LEFASALLAFRALAAWDTVDDAGVVQPTGSASSEAIIHRVMAFFILGFDTESRESES
jgi:hypothetical protein